jgi:hypothetical protein
MKNLRGILPCLLIPSLFVGCGDDGGGSSGDESDTGTASDSEPTGEPGECVAGEEVVDAITADTTWSCDKTLAGLVYVQDGATLTVEPGVTVRGKSGSALVIAQGGRLEAVGTKEQPVVFTSSQAEGARAPGDWGGVVFLGRATTNLGGGVGQAEGLSENAAYGGDEPDYDCGTLKWVRVEFAGFELTTDNELNGVTFYACGTGTTVDYLQVHMGQDDGVEWFGGGFDAKHIVVTGAQDDALDIDQGFTGTLQHIFIQQDPGVGNYCFEVSNQDINLDASPRTSPKICNATCIGTGGGGTKSAGIKLKEGASGKFWNSVLGWFESGGVDLTDGPTEAQAESGAIVIKNDLFYKLGDPAYVVSDGSSFDLQGFVEDPANMNQLDVDPRLTSVDWAAPNAVPLAGSPVLGAAGAVDGCEAADYIGAVKDAAGDWTTGWTNFATK